ncbi:MAG: 3-deoxy-7-phosphoheptulonate synthase [Deltaproteobacteria bacterium]|nr:3-deoxy-7-phosphoheptulonate synthase [Deltaproteobacteria bacterium]
MMMEKITDINIESYSPVISPDNLVRELPLSDKVIETVSYSRSIIRDILDKKDKRLLIITGPCSIHDKEAAIEYALKLKALSEKVESRFFIVMRVYFEKPRTSIGWKGLINDPCLDGSCDIESGLRIAREILLEINELGVPAATEMLDTISPQYFADLISWSAIGARTTESQTHREMVSGLSMPVGLKNGTDGDLMIAINGIKASAYPQKFIGIDGMGRTSIIQTKGNPYTHVVLRGGIRPNYDSFSISSTINLLKKNNLRESIIIDCSHGNSSKDYSIQPRVWQDVINQRMDGNDSITGLMLESNIHEGNQPVCAVPKDLRYGVSITDACISWEMTEDLIFSTYKYLEENSRNNGRYKY